MTKKVNIFDEVSNDAGSRIRSRDWYTAKIQELRGRGLVTKEKIMSYKEIATSKLEIGSMYMFVYNAKHKETLPYWDTFPLVLPFSRSGHMVTGFNLHYLPANVRWALLKTLLKNQDIASIRRLSNSTKMKMDYSTLKASTHIPLLKPTIHSYLFDHIIPVRGGMYLKIPPVDWHLTVLLPVQDFRSNGSKIQATTVWKDSLAG